MEQDNFDLSLLSGEAQTTPAPDEDREILEVINSGNNDTTPVIGRSTNAATDSTLSAKGALIAAQSTNDWAPVYKKIREEQLNFNGLSESLDRIQENRRQQSIRMAQLATANLAINGEHDDPVQATAGYSQAFRELTKEIQEYEIDKQLALDAETKYQPKTPEEENIFDSVAGNAIDILQGARDRTQARVNEFAVNQFSGDTAAFWAGVGQQIVPLMEAGQVHQLIKAYEEASGEKVDTSTWTPIDSSRIYQEIFATGDGKKALRQSLERLYIDNPLLAEEVSAQLIEQLPDITGVVYKNEYSSFFRLMELFGDSEYSVEQDKFIGTGGAYGEDEFLGIQYEVPLDNLAAILDVVGVGGLVRSAKNPIKTAAKAKEYLKYRPGAIDNALKKVFKDPKLKERFEAEVAKYRKSEIAKRTVTDSTAPNAPANIVKDHNPDQGTQLYEVALRGDDEASMATFGTTNKGDIAHNAYGMQIADDAGNVEFRAQPINTEASKIVDEVAANMGVRNLSEEELAAAHNKIQKAVELDNNGRVALRPNMSSYKYDGKQGYIEAVYAPKSGFWSPTSLVNFLTYGLRELGVTADQISFMRKVGDKLEEISPEELKKIIKSERKAKSAKKVKQDEFAEKNIKEPSPAKDIVPGSLRDDIARGPGVQVKGGVKSIEPGSQRDKFARGPEAFAPKAASDIAAGDKRSKFAEGPSAFNPADPKQQAITSEEAQKRLDWRNKLRKSPPGKKENLPPGGYFIRVKVPYSVSHTDVESLAKPEIVNNIFDRMFVRWKGGMPSDWKWGSLQQHAVDAASTFKDKFILGASNASDKASALEKYLFKDVKEFRNKFDKNLSKDEKAIFSDHVEKANREGLRFDPAQAKTDGWSDNMISAMHDFRAIWDKLWGMTNKDMVKTFKARGYKMLDDMSNSTSLLVKPIDRSKAQQAISMKGAKVYDPSSGKMYTINSEDLNRLYDDGGQLVESRRAVEEGGNYTKLVISKEKPGSSFTRALKDDEVVLPYREGYFSRRYKDSYFIVRLIKDKNGNVIDEVAVGSAKTRKRAQALEQRFKDTETEGAEYAYRRDEGDEMSENYKYDLETYGYTSAQKIRGEQLKGFRDDNSLGFSEIENPMEALVHSVKSISQRVAIRDWIETTKARLTQNYKDYLPSGGYPSSVSDIFYRGTGIGDDKMAADARTLFNYIRGIEDGYVNLIDEVYKHGFMTIADMFGAKAIKSAGKKSFLYDVGESAARSIASARGPAAAAKTLTSVMLLFSFPQRQMFVQGMQHLQALAVGNPSFVWTGKAHGQVNLLVMHVIGKSKHLPDSAYKALGTTREEIEHIYKAIDRSGQLAAVDKQNLVRGVLMDMTDWSAASRFKKVMTAPIHYARRIGMDFGESYNTMFTYLTMYDKAKSLGKNMNDVMVLEDVALASRNFSGMMNMPGDMPYNHNFLAVPFQFMQIGHKMVMNMTFNQHLSKTDKFKLGLLNITLFGVPMQQLLENGFGKYLPDDEDSRNLIVEGAMSYMVNEIIQNTMDSSTRLDLSGSLSPLNSPQMNIAFALLSGDIADKFASATTDSPVFGFSKKLGLFCREVSNWVVPDPNLHPSDVTTVFKSGANMFSGMSAYFKYSYLAEFNRTLSSKGVTQDYRTDKVAELAALLGISTTDEVKLRASQTLKYKTDKELDDDVKEWVRILGEQSKLRNITSGSLDYNQKAVASGFALFGHSPGSFEKVQKHLITSAKHGEWKSVADVWDLYFQGSMDEALEVARMLPDDNPNKQNVIKSLEAMISRKEESK